MSREYDRSRTDFGFDSEPGRRNEYGAPVGAAKPPGRVTATMMLRSTPADRHQVAEEGIRSATPMALPYQAQLEAAFGRKLDHVRAHAGPGAALACDTLGAEAYALGSELVFRSSSPSLHTVAHEVAHTFQRPGDVRLKDASGGGIGPDEQEADAAANLAVAGGRVDQAPVANISRDIPTPALAMLPYPSFSLSGPAVSQFLRDGGYTRGLRERLLPWPEAVGPSARARLAMVETEKQKLAEMMASHGAPLDAAVKTDVSSGALAEGLSKPDALRAFADYRYHSDKAKSWMKARSAETRSLAAALSDLDNAISGMQVTQAEAAKASLEEKKADLQDELDAAKAETASILNLVEKFVSIGVTAGGDAFLPLLNDAAVLFGKMLSTGQREVEAELASLKRTIRRIRQNIHATKARQDAAAISAAVVRIKEAHERIAEAESNVVTHVRMTMAKLTELRSIEAASGGNTSTFRETYEYQKKVAPQGQILLDRIEAALDLLGRNPESPSVASTDREGSRTSLALDRDLVVRIFDDRRSEGDQPTADQMSELLIWLGNNSMLSAWADHFFDWLAATVRALLMVATYLRDGNHLAPVAKAMTSAQEATGIPAVYPVEVGGASP